MVKHKEQHKKSIRFFNNREVRAVWDDSHNKWWFAALDILAAINEQDDYQKTRNYWKYLKTKLKKDNNELVSGTNLLKQPSMRLWIKHRNENSGERVPCELVRRWSRAAEFMRCRASIYGR